jgi:hypothetical protein
MADDDSDSNPSVEAVAQAVMEPDSPPPPTPKQIIAGVVRELGEATIRLQHAGRVAWQVSRSVTPTVEADRGIVRTELAAAGGDRRVIKRVAGEAVNALVNIRAAVAAAAVVAGRAETLIVEQRMRIKDSQTATTVDAAEFAAALAEQVQALAIPLMEIQAAIEEARLRARVIETTLQRRLQACYVTAVESQVEEITAQLRALKAQVDAVHARANQPDLIIASCIAVLDLLAIPELSVPTIVWPKWSSVGSKNPKSAWTGDPFAVPTLQQPEG